MTSGFSNLCSQIAEDYEAHGREWTKPGFRSVAIHRFGVRRDGQKQDPARTAQHALPLAISSLPQCLRDRAALSRSSWAPLNEFDKAPTFQVGASVGAGAVILGAVTLREGCAIGASPDVLPSSLSIGVPAISTGQIIWCPEVYQQPRQRRHAVARHLARPCSHQFERDRRYGLVR